MQCSRLESRKVQYYVPGGDGRDILLGRDARLECFDVYYLTGRFERDAPNHGNNRCPIVACRPFVPARYFRYGFHNVM